MNLYSDFKCGALSDSDYKFLSERENRREREYIDDFERDYYEGNGDLEIEYSDDNY